MIRGQVRSRVGGTVLEARVRIDIAGANLIFQTLEVVVDTGFTGSLALPQSIVHELGLEGAGRRHVTLADGQTIETPACIARLLWHGQPLDVRVPMMDSPPMIGSELLAGSHLAIDWWDGGDVIIEERMQPAE